MSCYECHILTSVWNRPRQTVMVPTAMGHARSSEIPSAANSAIQVSVPRNPLPPSGDDSPIVPQRIYRAKNKMRTQKQLSIRFDVNGQPGILLTDARDDRLQGLLDAGKLVFDATNIGKKVCYRIEVSICVEMAALDEMTYRLSINYSGRDIPLSTDTSMPGARKGDRTVSCWQR